MPGHSIPVISQIWTISLQKRVAAAFGALSWCGGGGGLQRAGRIALYLHAARRVLWLKHTSNRLLREGPVRHPPGRIPVIMTSTPRHLNPNSVTCQAARGPPSPRHSLILPSGKFCIKVLTCGSTLCQGELPFRWDHLNIISSLIISFSFRSFLSFSSCYSFSSLSELLPVFSLVPLSPCCPFPCSGFIGLACGRNLWIKVISHSSTFSQAVKLPFTFVPLWEWDNGGPCSC